MKHSQENKSTIDRSNLLKATPMMGLVSMLERVSPRLAAWSLEPLFLTPRRHRRPEQERAAFASAQRWMIRHGRWRVPMYAWGDGPVVLFAHGWEGRATQVAPFLGPLLAAGLRVVAYDMPGHGEAGRALVSVVDFAAVAETVARALGEAVQAAFGHSLGGTALTMAAARLPFAERIAVIGSPRHPRGFLAQFRDGLGLSAQTYAALLERLSRRYRLAFAALDAAASAASVRIPALIVHDRSDREVPFSHAERLAAAFPQGSLLATEALGHRRILRDREVVGAVSAFVAAAHKTRLDELIARELFDRDDRLRRAS